MPCLASFFDAVFVVKKLACFHYGDELLSSLVLDLFFILMLDVALGLSIYMADV